MMSTAPQNHILLGIVLAVAATIIWSGNFIIARGIINDIPPVSLSFFRWLTAVVILLPIAWKHIKPSWITVKQNKWYFIWTALMGVSLFNTFVYIAGHTSLALVRVSRTSYKIIKQNIYFSVTSFISLWIILQTNESPLWRLVKSSFLLLLSIVGGIYFKTISIKRSFFTH